MNSASPGALGAAGRRRRSGVAALVVGLLLAGTAAGQDDHFPFGPFRMYATTQSLNGAARWYRTEGVTAAGEVMPIPMSQFGLRRAEVEGQMDRFRADPRLLGLLVAAYERRRPAGVPLAELRIIRHLQPLRGGRPSGAPVEKVVLTWQP